MAHQSRDACSQWASLLRAETSALHSQLDSLPELSIFKSECIKAAPYRSALEHMYAPHCYLEGIIRQAVSGGQMDYDYQSRCELLARDIRALGGTPLTPLSDTATTDQSWPLNQLCGVLYLLEGSRLGGRFIQQQLEKYAVEPLPSRFMTSDADSHVGMKPFWQFLDRIPANDTTTRQVITAAQRAFQFYIDAVEHKQLNPQLLLSS